MSRIVALTGSTGFIGSEIARKLQASHFRVRALVRPESLAKVPEVSVDEIITGDVTSFQDLQSLVQDAFAVIHCAGLVRALSSKSFFATNTGSLETLVKVASRSNPKIRLLYISSLAAREPNLSAYSLSKYQGERILFEKAPVLSWTIFRPPAVYGPGDRELLPLFLWMKRGLAPVLGHFDNRVSLLYVSDLAEAVISWLKQDQHPAGCYELHDGASGGYSWLDVVATVSRLTGKHIRPIRIPGTLLYICAAVNTFLLPVLGRPPMLTPGKVRELTHSNWKCSNMEICRVLDWKPETTLEEGLRRTFGLISS